MKALLLVLPALIMVSQAYAAAYSCEVSGRGPAAISSKFVFDTDKEENKFISIGDMSAGAVVLRTTPQLVAITLGDGKNYGLSATAENGTSVLSLDTTGSNGDISLRCVKQ